MSKLSGLKEIIKKLKIDDTFTKPVKRAKKFTHVRDNIPLVEDYNLMADLLFLPKTKEGYLYCLVVVDLANNEFDIQPLKTKQSSAVLAGMREIIKRNIIKKPYASIQTDAGDEFKGVFKKWMYDESIYHKIGQPDRHTQMSTVEALNKQLGMLFNGYMNSKEIETGEAYLEWTDIIKTVREDLNKYRKINLPVDYVTHNYKTVDVSVKPKFKVGDIVHRQLDAPRNALNNPQSSKTFRMGDMRFDPTPRKIEKIVYFAGSIPFRYILKEFPKVSYTEAQLMASKETEEKYDVKEILEKKRIRNQIMYLVWFRREKKAEASWQSRKNLIEDGFGPELKEFDKKLKEKDQQSL